jgi:hypothetical protein
MEPVMFAEGSLEGSMRTFARALWAYRQNWRAHAGKIWREIRCFLLFLARASVEFSYAPLRGLGSMVQSSSPGLRLGLPSVARFAGRPSFEELKLRTSAAWGVKERNQLKAVLSQVSKSRPGAPNSSSNLASLRRGPLAGRGVALDQVAITSWILRSGSAERFNWMVRCMGSKPSLLTRR